MNSHRITSSRLLPLLVAAALPAALVTTPAPASAAPATCQKGKVAWKLDGRSACAAPARLGAATGPVAGTVAEAWLASASRPLPGGRVQLARTLRRAVPRAGRGLTRLIDRARGARPAARAAGRGAAGRGPIVDRQVKVTGRENLDDGVVAEGRVRARIYEDDSVDLEMELEMRDLQDNGVRFSPRFDDLTATAPVGCPAADGTVRATTGGEMGGTVTVLRGRRVLGAKTERHSWQAEARGQVGTDARLQSVHADVTVRTRTFTRGLGMQLTLRAPVSLTREGAPVLAGTPAVDMSMRAAGLSRAEERATEAEWVREAATSAAVAEAIGAVARGARERLLKAEPTWYDLPNDCAQIAWTPDPPLALAPGQTREVTGTVIATRDRGTASGTIAVTEVDPGGFAATVPAFSPARPASFVATAAAPDEHGYTVYANTVATSTAGRAKGVWSATGSASVQLPQSFRGTISSTSSGGGLTRAFSGSATFTRTSAARGPDGSTSAWYELTSASLDSATETHGPTEGCRIEARASGGRIDAGDLELRVLPDGAVTYALHYDVKAASTFGPTDCAPDHPFVPYDGDVSAVLDSGRPGPVENRLRPAGAGYRLEAAAVSDVTGVPGGTATASWSLMPE